MSTLTPGICSITLKDKSPHEIVALAVRCGLGSLEWWGGEHVPPGNRLRAQEVACLTREAGLEVASYGSYYRAGCSETEKLSFASILDSAESLGAPTIRVWAGRQNRGDCPAEELRAVLRDSMRIADAAEDRGLTITFEFHGGTLTDSAENARLLAEELQHPAIFFSWQPPHGFTAKESLAGLRALLPRLSTLHAYHWTIGAYDRNLYNERERRLVYPDDYHRHPLAEGVDRWQAYLKVVRQDAKPHHVLLEFVHEDCPDQVTKDAATLVELCRCKS
jgi:sugar phosphate isomerase/epimerase